MNPERFGKYEVVDKVGEGGFGTVYKGRDPDLKRPVAIKTLSAPDPELRERFLREAEIAAGLQHPSITTVFDFGTEEGRSYLVQEYLAGEDLDRVIARREPVERDRRLDWLIQIAEALGYAHSRDIVHRDVKPANMRVVDGERIKIMDFGIAKLLSAEDQLTRTGMTMGTAGYLPPEQLRGEAVDRRADIFSFGVLAYELLSYRRPFEGENLSAVLYRIAHEEHPPLAAAWPECPERLAAVIDRCLAKDPEARYPGLGPVVAELRAVRAALAGPQGADAETVMDPARLAPTVLATPGPRPAGGAPPAAEAGGTGGGTYRTAVRLPRSAGAWAALAAVLVAAAALGLWALWPGGDGETGSGAEPPAVEAGAAVQPGAPADGEPGTGAGDGGTAAAGGMDAAAAGAVPGPSPPAPTGPAGDAGVGAAAPPGPAPVPPPPAPVPSPQPPPVAAASSRWLLLISGEPPAAARAAQGALLRELAEGGLDAVAPGADSRGSDVGGEPARIAAAGRRHGASRVIVGTFQGEAQPSVGRFFTGRAVLELRIHDGGSGRLLDAGTVEVGAGDTSGKLAPSELTALNEAAEEAGRRAAAWVLAAGGGGGGP